MLYLVLDREFRLKIEYEMVENLGRIYIKISIK